MSRVTSTAPIRTRPPCRLCRSCAATGTRISRFQRGDTNLRVNVAADELRPIHVAIVAARKSGGPVFAACSRPSRSATPWLWTRWVPTITPRFGSPRGCVAAPPPDKSTAVQTRPSTQRRASGPLRHRIPLTFATRAWPKKRDASGRQASRIDHVGGKLTRAGALRVW